MMMWTQAWKAPLSVVVVVAVASDYLLSLVVVSVVVVALVAGWRSKHLLPLAVAVVVAVGGWRQRLPLEAPGDATRNSNLVFPWQCVLLV